MHTKERLKISNIKPDAGLWGPILQAESGRIIAFLARHPGQHPKEEAIAQEQADAERLVVAWNVLADLNPDKIQGLVEAGEAILARESDMTTGGSYSEYRLLEKALAALKEEK